MPTVMLYLPSLLAHLAARTSINSLLATSTQTFYVFSPPHSTLHSTTPTCTPLSTTLSLYTYYVPWSMAVALVMLPLTQTHTHTLVTFLRDALSLLSRHPQRRRLYNNPQDEVSDPTFPLFTGLFSPFMKSIVTDFYLSLSHPPVDPLVIHFASLGLRLERSSRVAPGEATVDD